MDKDDNNDAGMGAEYWLGIALAVATVTYAMKSSPSSKVPSAIVRDLVGKRYVITGANSGIGKATASALVARGADVVLAVRDVAAGEQAKKDIAMESATAEPKALVDGIQNRIHVRHCDLTSFLSIRDFAKEECLAHLPLSALINNAGMMSNSYQEKNGFELSMLTNYYGPLYLTSLLLPKLSKRQGHAVTGALPSADVGRVINVGSRLESQCKLTDAEIASASTGKAKGESEVYSMWTAYANSKHMQLLATRVQGTGSGSGTGVVAHCCTPGMVHTNIDRFMASPLLWLAWPIKKLFLNTPSQGAQSVVYAATADIPSLIELQASGQFWSVDKSKSCDNGNAAEVRVGTIPGSVRSGNIALAKELLQNSMLRIEAAVKREEKEEKEKGKRRE